MEKSDYPIEIHYNENFAPMEMKNHFHNLNEIIFVQEGSAEFTINGRTYSAGPGDMIFISNLENHELKVLEYPYKRYFVLINPTQFQLLINQSVLASIFKHRPEHFSHMVRLAGDEKDDLNSLVKKMSGEYTEKAAFWESNLGAYLNLLFTYLYRTHGEAFPLSTLSRSANMVLDIQKYIEQHYTEEISLEEVSRLFYSNMYYISHLFKKVTGFTFKEYILLLRTSHAKDLLYRTEDDITTISLNSGFNSVNHFIRIFKKIEGITPYQYRKQRM